MIVEDAFSQYSGMNVVIHEPSNIPTLCTMRNASMIPSSRCVRFFVFDERSIMDS